MTASLAFHSAYFTYTIEPLRKLNHPEPKLDGEEFVIMDFRMYYMYTVDETFGNVSMNSNV